MSLYRPTQLCPCSALAFLEACKSLMMMNDDDDDDDDADDAVAVA